jgi:hypothetical protein
MSTETTSNLLDNYWGEPEFAQIIGHSIPTLRRWAREKKGPPVALRRRVEHLRPARLGLPAAQPLAC